MMSIYPEFTLDTPIYQCDKVGRVDPNPIGTLRDVLNTSRYKYEVVIKGLEEFYSMRITFTETKREAFISSNCAYNSSQNAWENLNEFINSLPPLEGWKTIEDDSFQNLRVMSRRLSVYVDNNKLSEYTKLCSKLQMNISSRTGAFFIACMLKAHEDKIDDPIKVAHQMARSYWYTNHEDLDAFETMGKVIPQALKAGESVIDLISYGLPVIKKYWETRQREIEHNVFTKAVLKKED